MNIKKDMLFRSPVGIQRVLSLITDSKTKEVVKVVYKEVQMKDKRGVLVTRQFMVDIDEISNISDNIIDLIEVGDLVNGDKVIHVEYPVHQDGYQGYVNIITKGLIDSLRQNDIKSVLTKEQIESGSFRI